MMFLCAMAGQKIALRALSFLPASPGLCALFMLTYLMDGTPSTEVMQKSGHILNIHFFLDFSILSLSAPCQQPSQLSLDGCNYKDHPL